MSVVFSALYFKSAWLVDAAIPFLRFFFFLMIQVGGTLVKYPFHLKEGGGCINLPDSLGIKLFKYCSMLRMSSFYKQSYLI